MGAGKYSTLAHAVWRMDAALTGGDEPSPAARKMIGTLERFAALGGNPRTMEHRIGAKYGDAALPWAGGLPGGGEPGELHRPAIQKYDPERTPRGILEGHLGLGDLTGEPAREYPRSLPQNAPLTGIPLRFML